MRAGTHSTLREKYGLTIIARLWDKDTHVLFYELLIMSLT